MGALVASRIEERLELQSRPGGGKGNLSSPHPPPLPAAPPEKRTRKPASRNPADLCPEGLELYRQTGDSASRHNGQIGAN